MRFNHFGKVITSPSNYKKGFQLAQQEYERFLEVQNRLYQIKAFQQLKKGELFLEAIELNNQQENVDPFH